jgi:DNA-binding YbaB/EbfC family protein
MNMQQMMKQAQKMQEQLQKQMDATVLEATAGGGMVSLKMNGNKQLISIQIDPEVFAAADKEMLQDLIRPVNEGVRKTDGVGHNWGPRLRTENSRTVLKMGDVANQSAG